ncbi:alpha-isopropylmalate synthase regulatory domain-containing protein [Natronoglycomyces albus]|uniref:2-isopropylmalate synthase LeuA allosteric (dimerisation) domain-containing protein n=1 Tax=Natronoglycomyces albus TaxID=2811108 RepID=A0A895XMP8_9ACTN|nr:alpha-isopropylmalate synthase regulatory domain-containing protein [Natronoglycomyces albus]QSB04295.1 hypothetical protein JQS30_10840 [Natronoglycomyces albus]
MKTQETAAGATDSHHTANAPRQLPGQFGIDQLEQALTDERGLIAMLEGRGIAVRGKEAALKRLTQRVRNRRAQGWSFAKAVASFELLAKDELESGLPRPFRVESYRVLVEHSGSGETRDEATVRLDVEGERVISTAEGSGPVNALDQALRKALTPRYRQLEDMRLTDYTVRILSNVPGTAATCQVHVSTANADRKWTTVGVHENVIEASWQALTESFVYGLGLELAEVLGQIALDRVGDGLPHRR